MVPQYADRHMHRALVAPLRSSPAVQRLLIKLATVEVFLPPQQGGGQGMGQGTGTVAQYSRNLPLLQRVCLNLLRAGSSNTRGGTGETDLASECARALLLCGTLLQPVTVALPAVAALDTARSYVMAEEQLSFPDQVPVPAPVVSAPVPAPAPVVVAPVSVAVASSGGAVDRGTGTANTLPLEVGGLSKGGKRKRGERADEVAATVPTLLTLPTLPALPVPTPTLPTQTKTETPAAKRRREGSLGESAPKIEPFVAAPTVAAADDDDLSLPDIDIDAEPDI
mmetsp:Transcript_27157/g.60095  ORF Transcript_27157/g.60095 Transcript_27157/m.60095 type:complete len:281 (+) Transcript_27157:216-1058(+)